MTSSQPVVTPNALNFTPDNKRCYTYSGGVSVGASTVQQILEFSTNSEYIVARFQYTVHAKNKDDNSTFILSLNDTVIFYTEAENTETAGYDSPLELVIPPFSTVKITAEMTGSAGIDHGVVMWGEVYGMTETGYQ